MRVNCHRVTAAPQPLRCPFESAGLLRRKVSPPLNAGKISLQYVLGLACAEVEYMGFERVYTVWDYYDGPRSGIATCLGRPHHYECEWNKAADDYGDRFRLTPIDDDVLALALEQLGIWRAWENAFHRGDVPQSTHPGLPGQDSRHEELKVMLDARISAVETQRKRARGKFRARPGQGESPKGVMCDLEVEWSDVVPE
jgi:hypothetical protein